MSNIKTEKSKQFSKRGRHDVNSTDTCVTEDTTSDEQIRSVMDELMFHMTEKTKKNLTLQLFFVQREIE